jgi:PKD repeat protein
MLSLFVKSKYLYVLVFLSLVLNSTNLLGQGACSVNISASSLTFCAGGAVKLKATGATTYLWSTGETSDSIIVIPTATTTFSVVGSCNSGSANSSVTLTLINAPVANFTSSPNTPCANTPINFTNTTVSGTSYLWNFGDPLSGSLNSSTALNSSHAFSSAVGVGNQNYNVTLTVYSAPGCTSSVTKQVTVKQRPEALIKYFDEDLGIYNESRNIKYCRASDYLLDIINYSTTIATNASYQISWGDGTTGFSASSWLTDSSITHNYANFGYYNLMLTVTGTNGCNDTTSYSIYNGSNPRLIFNLSANEPQAVNVCVPNYLDFVASDFQNNDPATIYILTSNYDSIQTEVFTHSTLLSNPNLSFLFDTTSCGASGSGSGSSFTPNSYYIQLVAKNGCSELPKQYGPITTSMKPEAKYSGDTVVCINKEVKFTNVSDYGVAVNGNGTCDTTSKFHWRISPATGWGPVSGTNNVISAGNQLGSTNPSNNPATWGSRTLRVNFTTQGQYTVSIIVGNTCGNDTFTQVICVEQPPTPSFTLAQKTGCAPFTINPLNTSTFQYICKPVERKWIVSRLNGVCSADSAADYRFMSNTTDTTLSPVIKFNNQGTYLVKLRLKNSCDTFVVVDTVKIKTKPKFSLASITNACGDVKVKPLATITNCGNNPMTYQWNFSGGIPASSTQELPDSILFSGIGTHTVSLSVTNECGTKSDDTTFAISEPPIADAGIGSTLCEGETIQLNGSATQGSTPYSFSWSSNPAGFNSSQQNPSTTASQNITFSLTVTDAGNCVSTDLVTYSVIPSPVLTVNSATICSGDSVQLTVSGGTGYLWSNGSTSTTITVQPSSTTSYTVSATDSGSGCSGDEVSTVTVNQSPNVDAGPNIIACSQPVPTQLSGFSPSGGSWTGTGVTPGGEFQSLVNDTYMLYYFYQDPTTGCSNTDSLSVTVVSPQVADAGNGFSLCLNAPVQNLSGFTPAGGTWTGSGISGNNFNPATSGTGNIVLTYSFGAGSCLTQDTIKINVLELPALAVNSAAICSGKPAVLIATGADTYLWDTGETNDSITVSPSSAQNYTVTGTDTITGCTITQTATVTVNNLPVVSFTNVVNGCENSTINFNNTTQNASAYLWDFGDNSTSTDEQAQHVFSDTGTFQIQLIATSGSGCVDSSFGTIRIFDFPQSAFTLSAQQGCAPLEINYSNQSTGINATYSWNLGNGSSSDTIPASNTYQQGYNDTTYVISLTTSNFCGNSVTQDTILVKPKPIASFGTNLNEGCSPLPIFFNNNSAGNATQYIWDFGDGSAISNAINPSSHTFITGDRDTTYYITLIGINACGSDTIKKSVLIHPNTVNAFFNTTPSSGCAPLQVTFTNFSTGGSFFSWNFGDGNVSSSASSIHTYQNPGTYTCSLYVNNGCSFDTISSVIVVNSPPATSFVPDSTVVCAKNPISFTNTSVNCINFSWDFGDSGVSTLSNPSHTFTTDGTYTVSLTATSATFGCSSTYTMSILVRSLPIPIISSDTTIGCAPLTIHFQNQSQNSNFYTWNFGNGNTSSSVSPNQNYLSPGIYTIKLIAENLFGCVDSTTYSINVYDVPSASFSLSQNYTCSVPVAITGINTSVGATGFTWVYGNGDTLSNNNPTLTYLQFVQDTILLTATNSYGCSDTAVRIFYAIEPPNVDFVAEPDTGCQPLRVAFQNLTQFATSYYWKFGDSLTSTNMNAEHVYYDVGSYSVFLKGSNQFCSDSIVKNNIILVYPKPVADFTFDQIYIDGLPNGTIQFTDNSQDAVSYHWYFGDGEESEKINPLHQYTGYNNYFPSLVITNAFGCLDTATKLVVPDYFEGLFVPTALMPNNPAGGDSRLFLPKGKSLKEYRLQIFNSYGNLIFESTQLDINGSPTEGWDGTFKGIQCQQDAYVWEIEAVFIGGKSWQGLKSANGKYKKTGTLTLVK